ncbi:MULTISPECIES: SLC13 family permease [Mesorhizobium]|uniref:SLC13 family permease n=1 Tax=Mesorhizobium denitrificans TaxID=2294114 RepID=A0A371XGE8_9HYPH|nr:MULTISPECIES: SLC13 family permease [Mesorhizobium]RFC68263.1 SLC13 family permease [Mesorhizobium denitrificans]
MNMAQWLSIAVIVLMMAAFIWGKYRYDLVAAGALLLSLALGVVPFEDAFTGFSNDIVIIVGSALLVSAGVARSGIMELVIQRIAPNVSSVRAQLAILVIAVTIMSAFVKNIGALAIMIPIAFQFARRSNTSPSVFLMPMAFGSLLGGLMTQIGTSPNIVVSGIRKDMTGTAFTMFDFTPVGAILAVVGVVFLVLFWWLVPIRHRQGADIHEAIKIEDYISEARVLAGSTIVGKTVGDLMKLAQGDTRVTSIMRANDLRIAPLPDAVLKEGDILLLEGDHESLHRLVAQSKLSLTNERQAVSNGGELGAIEAVVAEGSPLIGWSAQRLNLFERYNVNLLAVSRRGERLTERLGQVTLRLGDVIVLQGDRASLPELLRDFGLLPLAERAVKLGSARNGLIPLLILVTAMGATAIGLLPVGISFFAAAVTMVLLKVIPSREVYWAMDGPILVMLATLIPVSDSLRKTGATDVIAKWLAEVGMSLPPYGSLALIMIAAMAITPFLNNAATVLVMAPIAASFATSLHFKPEAFLMAVAIGAGCDFLTPIGHQCNTLVMAPGGYRFSDYPRLGLPLSVLVILVGVPALMFVWPLQ